MKKHILILYILLFLSISISAQPYYDDLQERLEDVPYDELVNDYNQNVNIESRNANARGYEAYKAGDIQEAIRMWKESVKLDERNYFAHFNLACGESLLSSRDGTDRTGDILFHLKTAGAYNAYWGFNIFLDPDLDFVREEPFERSIVIPSSEDFGEDYYYYFFSDGTLKTGYNFPNLRGREGNEEFIEFPGTRESTTGYYTVIGETAIIYLPEGNVYDKFRYQQMFPDDEPEPVFWIFLDLNQIMIVDLDI